MTPWDVENFVCSDVGRNCSEPCDFSAKTDYGVGDTTSSESSSSPPLPNGSTRAPIGRTPPTSSLIKRGLGTERVDISVLAEIIDARPCPRPRVTEDDSAHH